MADQIKKWRAVVTIDASASELVEAATEDEAREKARIAASGHGLCHHCTNHIELGDVIDVVEIYESDED